ncbi:MAG: hypothetical protein RLZZ196_3072 [Bacteroidota bacterium]|jgi:hypothetical protein
MAYYQVKVEFHTTDIDSGKVKKQNVLYLVESESVTESEARMVEHLTAGGTNDFEVKSSFESKIADVIYPIVKK